MSSNTTLNMLKPGERAMIDSLRNTGSMRRRLLDLGFIPFTELECVGRSPGGDPSAYSIRGAVIAIRSEDSQHIIVKPLVNPLKSDKVIAIAGNPNVGKSTVFNALTGMKQNTGNWPDKTVAKAQGYCIVKENSYLLVDTPGTYSLMAHSVEEEVARDFICFGNPDAVIVVCDATCLERNLNLVLQIIETGQKVVVCVNLMDEAKHKHIRIDLPTIEKRLGVPVVGIIARQKKYLDKLTKVLDHLDTENTSYHPIEIHYPDLIEQAIQIIDDAVSPYVKENLNSRWLSLRLLDSDSSISLTYDFLHIPEISAAIAKARESLEDAQITKEDLKDTIVSTLVSASAQICADTVIYEKKNYHEFDRRMDRMLTSKITGYPIMIFLLALVFWLTIAGANIPSGWLSVGLFWIQDRLTQLFQYLQAPTWLHGSLVLGVYRVLA